MTALTAALEEMENRVKQIDAELAEIKNRYLLGDLVAEVLPGNKVSIDQVAEVGKRIGALTLMQQRALVKHYLRVTVGPGRAPERIVIQAAASGLPAVSWIAVEPALPAVS
jgi:hypothetical protein